MFHTADKDDIRSGRLTDVYFARTVEILRSMGVDKRVKAEFIVKKLPEDWNWAVLAGIEEVSQLMQGKPVTIRAMYEGTVFRPLQPVLEIEGKYTDFAVFETAMLGFICQASGIATKAARCRIACGDRTMVSFGARRMHPVIAPMIERAAYIGGCDGVAVVISAELIHTEPVGTMPHALVLVFGDTIKAIKAFDKTLDAKIKRVALIDTFNDEKIEAIRVAEAMKGNLFAVRLDTPSSRRGDFYSILEEVRWELDLRGFKDVKLFASGGLDEVDILRLRPIVDAFGVGTSISNAPVVDFSMDIVEVEGKPLAKRGKWSGSKQVARCRRCFEDMILPAKQETKKCKCGGLLKPLLSELIINGNITRPAPGIDRIREKALKQINRFEI